MDNFAVTEWIRYANKDLKVVNILVSHYPPQLEIICYHCQQSAEKMLKAFLVYSNVKIVKTHDLTELFNMCEEIDDTFSSISEICDRLDPYSNQPRYPFGLEITNDIMQLAVKDCKEIMEFINAKIKYEDDKDVEARED